MSFGESRKAKRRRYFSLRNSIFGEGGRSVFDHTAYFKQDYMDHANGWIHLVGV